MLTFEKRKRGGDWTLVLGRPFTEHSALDGKSQALGSQSGFAVHREVAEAL